MNRFLRPIIAMALSLALPPVTVHAQYIEKQEGAVKANVPVSDFTDYKHKLFNFGWRFCLGNPEGAESVDFDDSSWRTLDLPHDYQFEQPWEENENKGRGFKRMCEGWYRKTFTVPETLKGRRVLLDFEGV